MAKWRLFPELELVEEADARHAVYRAALKKLGWRWQYLVYAGVAPVVALLGAHIGLTYLGRIAPFVAQYRTVLFVLAAGLVLPLTFTFVFRRMLAGMIREELVRRGVPVCVGCGYDLRGQEVARCPECGARFEAGLLRRGDGELPPRR